MKLAERGSFIGDKKDGIWVKEIRKLTKNGHQTSIITTAYTLLLTYLRTIKSYPFLIPIKSFHQHGENWRKLKIQSMENWQQMQIDLAEEITLFEAELKDVKSKQNKIPKHIIISELPEDEQFKNLDNSKKNLLDAVKMIAYRTETAMGNLIANECGSLAKARALLRDLFVSEADILPEMKS